jgi:hypothetical protein
MHTPASSTRTEASAAAGARYDQSQRTNYAHRASRTGAKADGSPHNWCDHPPMPPSWSVNGELTKQTKGVGRGRCQASKPSHGSTARSAERSIAACQLH